MDGGEIIGMMAVFGLIVIPSLGFTARFALKPIVDSVLRVREALDRQRPTAIEDPRVAALQQEVFDLRETVDRLSATAEFDAQLRGGQLRAAQSPVAAPPPPVAAPPLPRPVADAQPVLRAAAPSPGPHDVTDYAQEYE